MVLDTIANAERSYSLHPGFKAAFEHLKTVDFETVGEGRHEIDGSRLYMIVNRGSGKGKDNARFEAHQRYIDIQCTISGDDLIGWKNIKQCAGEGLGYNPEKDIEFYASQSPVWVPVPAGTFGIYFPEDVHAPKGSTDLLMKIILKVAVDWE
jgi:YhcH/YjgK/YiaL family protein